MTDRPPIDAPKLAALAAFGARFGALGELTDPLQAIVEAAHLKGRIDVLLQIQVFELADAREARQLIDLILAGVLDQRLASRALSEPIEELVPRLQDYLRTL